MLLSLATIKQTWFGNIKNDLLAGLVVALALIPEAIAFSIIAGVDPKVGLYASFSIAIVIAFVGGRPAMISAATGAMALVMVMLVKEHGLQYLFATTILTGILQILAGIFKLGSLIRFVSKSVMIGFVNALAILIFMAQLPEFEGAGIMMYGMVALGLAIIYLFPYITKAVPSPLICIIVITIISLFFDLGLRTVGDMGELPSTLPIFFLPDIPLNWETFMIIFPYAVTLAAVGLLESLLTANIIDDLTETTSNKNRECSGQGIANVITGFFGGMAGCAMIGQSMINVKSGGRGRLSTLSAGLFLLFLLLVINEWVAKIPMAALVAVMIMVSISTFNWYSIKNIKTNPKGATLVMLVTVAIVVATHNLALGVFVGVLLSALLFARKVAQIMYVLSDKDEKDHMHRIYTVYGQVFFASTESFSRAFNIKEDDITHVTIDISHAHFWDLSAVSALEMIVSKFHHEDLKVKVTGINEASKTLMDQVGLNERPGSIDLVETP